MCNGMIVVSSIATNNLKTNTNTNTDEYLPLTNKKHKEFFSHYLLQLKWISLTFFLTGGILYIISSVHDILILDKDADTDASMSTLQILSIAMIALQALRGFCYCMCGVTDSYICYVTKKMRNIAIPSTSLAPSLESKMTQDEAVAFLLTIGGALDMACGLSSSNEPVSDSFDLVSNHFYFFEASVAIFGNFFCHKCFHKEELQESMLRAHEFSEVFCLEKFGDLLFLIGSTIDLVSGYLYVYDDYYPSSSNSTDATELHRKICYWQLGSSILWFIDALLYTLGALIDENKKKKINCNTNKISVNKK